MFCLLTFANPEDFCHIGPAVSEYISCRKVICLPFRLVHFLIHRFPGLSLTFHPLPEPSALTREEIRLLSQKIQGGSIVVKERLLNMNKNPKWSHILPPAHPDGKKLQPDRSIVL